MKIVLSVSIKKVTNKDEGKKVREYKTRTFYMPKDKKQLIRILLHHNHTANLFRGLRKANNVKGVSGLILDYDTGISFEAAIAFFKRWNNVIYTTTSHTKNSPHIRAILPFRKIFVGDYYALYSYFKKLKSPQIQLADKKCFEPGRHFFPNCSKTMRYKINTSGHCLAIPDEKDLPKIMGSKNPGEGGPVTDFYAEDLRELDALLNQIYQKGERNEAIFVIAIKAKKCNLSIGDAAIRIYECRKKIFSPDNIPYSEIIQTVRSAYAQNYKMSKENPVLKRILK